MTTTLFCVSANKSRGRSGTFFSGIVTTTTSPNLAASLTDTGFAPVSAAKSASDSGPRELATATSCPKAVKRWVRVPPICPAPIIPIFITVLSKKLGPCCHGNHYCCLAYLRLIVRKFTKLGLPLWCSHCQESPVLKVEGSRGSCREIDQMFNLFVRNRMVWLEDICGAAIDRKNMREILRWHGPGEVSQTVRLEIVHTHVHSNGANLPNITFCQ